MNLTFSHAVRPACALLLMGAVVLGEPALAKSTRDTDLLARYQQERAVCTSGQSHQDRDTCLREAGAAYAQARRGGLDDGAAPYAANQRKRCEPLPADDRKDCLARMDGQGRISGSVAGGGILRELVTVVPGVPASEETETGASKPVVKQ